MLVTKTKGAAAPTAPAAAKPSSSKTEKAKEKAKQTASLLPTEISEPVQHLGDCVITMFGEKKIGKTSLAGEFPDALFLMFEPGGKGLRIYQAPMPDWRTFVKILDELEKNPERFRTVVVDTVDIAYERCWQWVCQEEVVDHPNEGAYGAIWSKIDSEFKKQMNRLIMMGRGVIFTSHAEVKSFQSRSGGTYDKMIPSMSNQARKFMTGVADIIAYYGYYGEQRFLTIQGSDSLDAGHRMKEKFRTKTGERIHSIPMGKSAEEAYANVLKAFDNQQDEVCIPEESTGLSDVRAKMTSTKKSR